PLSYPATPALHTLSLHDALPILGADRSALFAAPTKPRLRRHINCRAPRATNAQLPGACARRAPFIAERHKTTPAKRARPLHHSRSEEHTSELQSRENLVCRLLLE